MRWYWTRALLVGALGLAVGGAIGCAEEREPINRVQANALPKSFFVGEKLLDTSDDPEFWTQGTVIDVGYGAAQDGLFTSTYAQPVARMKWVIQEDLLIGRLTYERIEDSDGKGAGAATNDGIIVVAYPIIGHFDIRRDYNPSTGEESNVIVENTSDRPWYEREYIRVDWSRNLNVDSYDFDTLSMMGIFGGIKYESLAYYVNDPSHPDAPHFDAETGYFDVTNKAFAVPGTIDLRHFGWGIDSFPSCFLDNDFLGGSAPHGNCNPVEITIRQAFRRVDVRDYEPVDYDGYRFQAYGIFTNDRWGYSRNYGMTDDKRYRFMNRYNLWETSHFYGRNSKGRARSHKDPKAQALACYTPETTPYGEDPNRDYDGNGTADECEAAGAGSRCDTFNQKCTLPYAERQAVPIAWYHAEGSNPEVWDGTDWATHEWDVAMRSAVMVAKYAECMRVSGDEATCMGAFPVWTGQQDDNEDAVGVARAVDDCRHTLKLRGLSEKEAAKKDEKCQALAEPTALARGLDPANNPSHRAIVETAKMPEMIVLCHSPVEETDPVACGEVGLRARRGDLRYHQVNSMLEPQTPSPWGIMVDSVDPITGMKISASINIWTHVNDLLSQSTIDTIRYLKGELRTEDVTEGTYVKDWASAAQAMNGGGALGTLSHEEVGRRVSALSEATHKPLPGAQIGDKPKVDGGLLKNDAAMQRQVREMNREIAATVRAEAGAPSQMRAVYEARRKMAAGTPVEAELMTKAMQEMAGIGSLPLADAVAERASVFRGANPSIAREFRQMKEQAIAARGACFLHPEAAPAPSGIPALAAALERKFGAFNPAEDKATQQARAEKMRKYLAQRFQYNVILHEMGHSIGHRHNFVSSSDAFNYRPQYWQLRTKNGQVSEPCEKLDATGENCVGPRYFDPVTPAEREQLLEMFMQSSVMDYAGEITQDVLGLGAYDFAATRMFYADAVAVYRDPSFAKGTDRGKGALAKMDSFGGILGFAPSIGDRPIHYSQMQKEYDLIQNCQPVDPAAYVPSTWNTEKYGNWDPLVDGLLVAVDGQYMRCDTQQVDYLPWDALRPASNSEAGGFSRGGNAIHDPSGRVRVPYGFATDRWADLGNLAVYRHDNGADAYELFNFLITQQEVGHIFDNYRRNRASFSIRSAAFRTLGRYNEKMRDGAKGLGLIANIYRDYAAGSNIDFNQLWRFFATDFKENILASGIAFDHFARQMARPEVGPHYRDPAGNVLRSMLDMRTFYNVSSAVVIPNGAVGFNTPGSNVSIGGRPLENRLDETKGEYDAEYTLNAGSYYDKVFAPMLFTESVDNFISSSRHDFLDARERAVSLADLFPEGYRRWIANNLTGDDFIKGARLAAGSNGAPLLDAQTPVNGADDTSECTAPGGKCQYPAQGIGWTTWWTDQPEVCFPADNTTVCTVYGQDGANPFDPKAPANTVAIDPQVGWEQQKFLIAMTLVYLPENQKRQWLDMMQIWELGKDNDPEFENRIEFHHPSGQTFVARTYGKETLFGKTVQKGISARILEYANELLVKAYEVTEIDHDGDGTVDWYEPVVVNGKPVVKFDPDQAGVGAGGTFGDGAEPGCDATDNSKCTCEDNVACIRLGEYVSVPDFMRRALSTFDWLHLGMKGIY